MSLTRPLMITTLTYVWAPLYHLALPYLASKRLFEVIDDGGDSELISQCQFQGMLVVGIE